MTHKDPKPEVITLKEIKEALQRSGYLLESRLDFLLRRMGYLVEANSALFRSPRKQVTRVRHTCRTRRSMYGPL